MIGATFISCRVQSAPPWSKRPPSSCCRWRSPDAPWARKRISRPIQSSSLRAVPGMAPARIPISPRVGLACTARCRGSRAANRLQAGLALIRRNGGRRRTASRPSRTPGSIAPGHLPGLPPPAAADRRFQAGQSDRWNRTTSTSGNLPTDPALLARRAALATGRSRTWTTSSTTGTITATSSRWTAILRPSITGSMAKRSRSSSITDVPKELGGKGIGSKLVQGALDQVRADGLKLIPQCPSSKAWDREAPELCGSRDAHKTGPPPQRRACRMPMTYCRLLEHVLVVLIPVLPQLEYAEQHHHRAEAGVVDAQEAVTGNSRSRRARR